MEEDKFALVEKIIKDVESILGKNAELSTFEIVPADINLQNKSPVLIVDNCLGIESWCVKHVYMYCYAELMDKFFIKSKRKPVKITSISSDRLTKLLNITLLLNPDWSSLWNKRKEMVTKCLINKLFELRFTQLVLSRKPKCNDAFAYRRWILESLFEEMVLPRNSIENIINEELNVCDIASEKSPNNYHSWNHRIWLMNKLASMKSEVTDIHLLLINEYIFSERCMSKHVSDYCCNHYRQFCIKYVLNFDFEYWKRLESAIDLNLRKSFVNIIAKNFPGDETVHAYQENLISYNEEELITLLLSHPPKKCCCVTNKYLLCKKLEILFYELSLSDDYICFYKCHETLWYHRRFITYTLMEIMYSYFGLSRLKGVLVRKPCTLCNTNDFKQAKIVKYDINQVYCSSLFNVLKCHERKFIDERRTSGDNYADRHEKYLKFVLGITV